MKDFTNHLRPLGQRVHSSFGLFYFYGSDHSGKSYSSFPTIFCRITFPLNISPLRVTAVRGPLSPGNFLRPAFAYPGRRGLILPRFLPDHSRERYFVIVLQSSSENRISIPAKN